MAVEDAAIKVLRATERLALAAFEDRMCTTWCRFQQQDDPSKRLVPAEDARTVIIDTAAHALPVAAGVALAMTLSKALEGSDYAFLIWRDKPAFTTCADGKTTGHLTVIISDTIGRKNEQRTRTGSAPYRA